MSGSLFVSVGAYTKPRSVTVAMMSSTVTVALRVAVVVRKSRLDKSLMLTAGYTCRINPLEPLNWPPWVRPVARTLAPAPRESPVRSQPAVTPIRAPAPSRVQVAPLLRLCSKTTSPTSGADPTRLHRTRVASGIVRLCVAESLSRRATFLLTAPPMVVKSPPMSTLPSACTASP